MLQSKDIEWLNEYKNRTLIYAAYKKLTSGEGVEKVFHAYGNKKKAG